MHFLTPQQLESFNKDGFLIIPDFFTSSAADELLTKAHKLLDDFDLSTHPKTRFTCEDKNHVGDDYFLSSGDQIRYFFEVDAFDQQGNMIQSKQESINKIGHGLHFLDETFHKFTTQQSLKDIARDIGFQDCRVLQSMVICKQPKIGGQVSPHIDSTFLYTDPPSAVGFWFALEDCTQDNGCMWFVPGSHKKYPVTKRFVRDPSGNGTMFEMIGNHSEPARDEYICYPTRKGSLVLIHGQVYHLSTHNHSEKSRFIYTFHMIEGNCKYDERNWLQHKAPFMKLFDQ